MSVSKTKQAVLSNVFCSVVMLASIPSMFLCLKAHHCMGGHWAHPPYPSWHVYTDGHWLLSFLLIAGVDFLSFKRFRMAHSVILIYLCIKPFAGYPDSWFALTLLFIYAVAGLRLLCPVGGFIYRRLMRSSLPPAI
ncbi:MAG: hypothetical protein ACYTCN_07485 [Planctomycetota bacterium]|jgi:hypothetical protein